MNRRKFIATTGGIGAATIGGFALFTGSVAAQIVEREFVGTTIEGSSEDGSVSDIRAGATNVVFGFEGKTYQKEHEPEDAIVELQVDHDGVVETIDTATKTVEVGKGTQTAISLGEDLEGSVLDHERLSASDFEAAENGSTTEKDITLVLKVTVIGASDSSEADLNVVIHNTHDYNPEIGGEAQGEVIMEEEDDEELEKEKEKEDDSEPENGSGDDEELEEEKEEGPEDWIPPEGGAYPEE